MWTQYRDIIVGVCDRYSLVFIIWDLNRIVFSVRARGIPADSDNDNVIGRSVLQSL